MYTNSGYRGCTGQALDLCTQPGVFSAYRAPTAGGSRLGCSLPAADPYSHTVDWQVFMRHDYSIDRSQEEIYYSLGSQRVERWDAAAWEREHFGQHTHRLGHGRHFGMDSSEVRLMILRDSGEIRLTRRTERISHLARPGSCITHIHCTSRKKPKGKEDTPQLAILHRGPHIAEAVAVAVRIRSDTRVALKDAHGGTDVLVDLGLIDAGCKAMHIIHTGKL